MFGLGQISGALAMNPATHV